MLFGDYECFEQIYFFIFKNMYFSGDGVCCDEDGYYWIIGCVDDVLNVFGYCLGMVEIELVLVVYLKIVEVVVVGILYNIKGQVIYVYVMFNYGEELLLELYVEVCNWVCKEIGLLVMLDVLYWIDFLFKICFGKIMCCILCKIVVGDISNLGDILMFVDSGVVEKLFEEKQVIVMLL